MCCCIVSCFGMDEKSSWCQRGHRNRENDNIGHFFFLIGRRWDRFYIFEARPRSLCNRNFYFFSKSMTSVTSNLNGWKNTKKKTNTTKMLWTPQRRRKKRLDPPRRGTLYFYFLVPFSPSTVASVNHFLLYISNRAEMFVFSCPSFSFFSFSVRKKGSS